jgi:uncharacterized protein YxeA
MATIITIIIIFLLVFLGLFLFWGNTTVNWNKVPSHKSSPYVETMVKKHISPKDKANLLTYNIENYSKAAEEIKKMEIKDVSDFIAAQNMINYIHTNGIMQYNDYHN